MTVNEASCLKELEKENTRLKEGVYMLSESLITKVHHGMRIISADGVYIGKVWEAHLRDTEACIEIRPHNFWDAFLEAFALRPMQPGFGHLYLPASTITKVVGKHVRVGLDAGAVRESVSRPPWIDREKMPRTSWNSNGL